MAQTAGEHLQELLAAIESLPGTFDEPPLLDIRSDTRALLIAHRRSPDDVLLAVGVLADSSQDTVEWLSYRLHLMDRQERCIVRFDNTAHHGELATVPHHRHEGPDEHVMESEKPTIHTVLGEIRRYLVAGR